jgi:hypothetical protein
LSGFDVARSQPGPAGCSHAVLKAQNQRSLRDKAKAGINRRTPDSEAEIPTSNREAHTMTAFNFSRRGFFHRLLAALAVPLLPRTGPSADGHLVASYLYDKQGRLISATYTLATNQPFCRTSNPKSKTEDRRPKS